jgi:hypothetical protein
MAAMRRAARPVSETEGPVRVKKAELGPLILLSEGGFGRIFGQQDRTFPGDATPLVYKEFTAARAGQARSAEATVAFRSKLTEPERIELDKFAAWPRAIVEDDSGTVTGFLMPLIAEDFNGRIADPQSGAIISRPREISWLGITRAAQRCQN